MVSFPHPSSYHNLTEKERDQAMLLYHVFRYYIEKQLYLNQGLAHRIKKIEEYQKKVLTNQ